MMSVGGDAHRSLPATSSVAAPVMSVGGDVSGRSLPFLLLESDQDAVEGRPMQVRQGTLSLAGRSYKYSVNT